MTITENDFIEKMIEIAKTGYENMTQLQCVFFTWNFSIRKKMLAELSRSLLRFSLLPIQMKHLWTKLTISGENSPAIYKKI